MLSTAAKDVSYQEYWYRSAWFDELTVFWREFTTPGRLDYVSWLHKLNEEGLFDQDNFSLTDTTIKAKVHDDKVGISMTSMGQLNNWNKEEVAAGREPVWMGIPYPTDDDGNISSIFGGSGIGGYTYMISKTADEETMKLCLQVLDYAYTQEGFLYWNFGVQGVSWDYDENGEPAFLPLVNAVSVQPVFYGAAAGIHAVQTP